MMIFIWIISGTVLAMLIGVGLLHLLSRMGGLGKSLIAMLSHAPGLDLAVTYFLILPPVVGACIAGWIGLAGAVIGQIVGLQIWVLLHELAHPDARKGPRIVKVLNRVVGTWRNHAALWVTAVATPLFWLVRMAEVFLYPLLIWLVGFPRYRTKEWINISRHKFEGLVGHDLIWCLYCDWMTGVWSLGSDMLRSVESFWCPIRFDSTKKCENCKTDFPDIDGTPHSAGWVDAHAKMAEVAALLEQQYGPDGPNSWYGHPARLTVRGRDIAADEASKEQAGDGDQDK